MCICPRSYPGYTCIYFWSLLSIVTGDQSARQSINKTINRSLIAISPPIYPGKGPSSLSCPRLPQNSHLILFCPTYKSPQAHYCLPSKILQACSGLNTVWLSPKVQVLKFNPCCEVLGGWKLNPTMAFRSRASGKEIRSDKPLEWGPSDWILAAF